MPSHLHEVLVELFRQRPTLAPELLSGALGITLPGYDGARVESAELTDLNPAEYRADNVVVLTDAERPVAAVIVEVQLNRDTAKRGSWPVYLAALHRRWTCPALLLVFCVDAAIARWCATPVELGHPGFRLVPLVLGPDLVPVVTDPAQAAKHPELAVLSARAHGADPARRGVLDALLSALAVVDDDHVAL